MTTDPFEELRVVDDPGRPDPRFVARLKGRVTAALGVTTSTTPSIPASVPTIELPDRNPIMSDTSTLTTTAAVATIQPYICVSPAIDALAWYAETFGAVETVRYTGDDGRVGHAEISIGGAVVMLSDEYPELGIVAPTTLGGTPVTLHLVVPDVDDVYARAVAGRARPAGEPTDEAYGFRGFSMLDPFGHRWMVQTPLGNPTLDEIQAAVEGYTITAPATGITTSAGTPVVELGYFTLGLPDTLQAGRFYGALFGWATEQGHAGDDYAHVANTQLPLGFAPGAVDEAPVLYFRVDDIAAYAARVGELGGEVISQTAADSGPNAVCRDDQGRQFHLWQPAPGY